MLGQMMHITFNIYLNDNGKKKIRINKYINEKKSTSFTEHSLNKLHDAIKEIFYT